MANAIVKALRRIAACIPQPARRMLRGQNGVDAFQGSRGYWDDRYRAGGTSGAGSYGHLAHFKAEFINGFVEGHAIASVIEFGCGDGNQLSLMHFPRYIGVDVTPAALQMCEDRFHGDPSKTFFRYSPELFLTHGGCLSAELALSLDVIYHLIEDEVYSLYMSHLFTCASRFVIVYSSDREDDGGNAAHVRHRRFTKWTSENAPEWTLLTRRRNRFPFDSSRPSDTSFCDFFVFGRKPSP